MAGKPTYSRGLGTPREPEPCLKVAGRVSAESAHPGKEPDGERVGEISLQQGADPYKSLRDRRSWGRCMGGGVQRLGCLPYTSGCLELLEHNQSLQDLPLPSALFLPGSPQGTPVRLSVKMIGGGGRTEDISATHRLKEGMCGCI